MSVDFKTAVDQEISRLQVIHPTPDDIPGCMTLLDDFLSCHALGSQMKSLYRHGGMSVCSRKMEDFKFCMSLKSMHPEDKRDAWIRRRAEWWAMRRLGKSSEEVWSLRTGPPKELPPPPNASDIKVTI